MNKKYDLVTLGAGPGGYVAAIRAAQLGMKTAVIERDRLGGVCLNWGCIPSKALLRSAEAYLMMKKSAKLGINCNAPEVDFKNVIKRSRQVADRMSKGVSFLMKKNKIDVYMGTGKISADKSVTIADPDGEIKDEIKAARILIASGAIPKTIPGIKLDRKTFITSKEAMTLDRRPESLTIIGAGAIGAEFAYFYNAVGTKVHLAELLPHALPLEDEEISKVVEKSFKKQGINVYSGSKIKDWKKNDDGISFTAETPKGEKSWNSELCLVATGVRPNSDEPAISDLNLEKTRDGFIKVNEYYQTSQNNVYAIGDIAGPPLLAHKASHEGLIAVESMAGKQPAPLNYSRIPACTYCVPQVASIGLNEKTAQEKGYEPLIGQFPFQAVGKALASGEWTGFVKLIFDKQTKKLLGAHMTGPEVTELVAELGLALEMNADAQNIAHSVHAHPTLSEAVMEAAAAALGQAVHI